MAGDVAWKVVLPKGITKGRRGGVAFLSEKVRSALEAHLASKRAIGEPMGPTAPLFRSFKGRRLFARHANPITTVAYTHQSDEELYERIGRL